MAELPRDNLHAALRGGIIDCRLSPGGELREQDLVVRLRVSRQPVREALLRLDGESLVVMRSRQGCQVRPIRMRDARDLFRCRQAVEPACVAEAIENAPAAAITALDACRGFEAGDSRPGGGVGENGIGRECGTERFSDHFDVRRVMVATSDAPFDCYEDAARHGRLR